ncbi:MAG: VanW family protein, partial [Firmicutes bacterium]|nr:VanW family protein [Bacillota bacterium]
VSTTLYGAVLRTEMEVTSRRPHSLVSNYVPPGQDAMVSWNLSDLTFVNTYKTPIYLYARCRGGELTVSIYGNSEDKKDIFVDTEIIRYIPYKTETVIDSDLPKGSHYVRSSGKRGLECSVIRTISQNGEVLNTETISHDIYAAQKEVIVSAP